MDDYNISNDFEQINRNILLSKSNNDLDSIQESLFCIIDNAVSSLGIKIRTCFIADNPSEFNIRLNTFLIELSNGIKTVINERIESLKGKILELDFQEYAIEVEEGRKDIISKAQEIYNAKSNILFNGLSNITSERASSLNAMIWKNFEERISSDIKTYDRELTNYYIENMGRYNRMEASTGIKAA